MFRQEKLLQFFCWNSAKIYSLEIQNPDFKCKIFTPTSDLSQSILIARVKIADWACCTILIV